jgi:hypothetical protein
MGGAVTWFHRTVEDRVTAPMNSGFSVTWFHRMAENHVTAPTNAGFVLTSMRALREDRLDGNMAVFERRRRVPLLLLLADTRT